MARKSLSKNETKMKKFILISCIFCSSSILSAQQVESWDDIPVVMDTFGHKIAPDGSFSYGEVISTGSAFGRDNITGEVYYYDQCSIGDGNSITKDHIIVGTDKYYMKAAFLLPQEGADPWLVPSLEKYTESYLHGITWDGTRLVGILMNPKGSDVEEVDPDKQTLSYLPFYCDRDPDTGVIYDPVFLPVPEKDFFGLVPQNCTAYWISDDGSTILGQVVANSGEYIYPIVYKEGSNGNWTYELPSKDLFNPNGLQVPEYPRLEVKQPNPVDYIGNPEFKKLFQELLDAFTENSTDNPYDLLNPAEAGEAALMTLEEWKKYSEDKNDFDSYFNLIYQDELDKYYDEYSKFIAQSYNFLQSSMAMNRAGTKIAQTWKYNRFAGTRPVSYEKPIIFNLQDGTHIEYGPELSRLEVNQILPDGTLIATSPSIGPTSPDETPQHSYVCPPGGDDFILIEEYIKNENPELYEWYMEYLNVDVPIGYNELGGIEEKNMTVSGLVSVSDDFTVLSAGVDCWAFDNENGAYITYVVTGVTNPNAGVDEIKVDNENGGLTKVYNMQGVKILETKQPGNLNSLSSGIYIINGKKALIK